VSGGAHALFCESSQLEATPCPWIRGRNALSRAVTRAPLALQTNKLEGRHRWMNTLGIKASVLNLIVMDLKLLAMAVRVNMEVPSQQSMCILATCDWRAVPRIAEPQHSCTRRTSSFSSPGPWRVRCHHGE